MAKATQKKHILTVRRTWTRFIGRTFSISGEWERWGNKKGFYYFLWHEMNSFPTSHLLNTAPHFYTRTMLKAPSPPARFLLITYSPAHTHTPRKSPSLQHPPSLGVKAPQLPLRRQEMTEHHRELHTPVSTLFTSGRLYDWRSTYKCEIRWKRLSSQERPRRQTMDNASLSISPVSLK